jgi:hypothetical protein
MIIKLSLQICGIEEETKIWTKYRIENLFNEIIAENFQNPGKDVDIQVHDISPQKNLSRPYYS